MSVIIRRNEAPPLPYRFGILRHRPRDVLPNFEYAPDTIPLQDRPAGRGKGDVIPVLPPWWDYIHKLNPGEKEYRYTRSIGAMWINIPYDQDDPNPNPPPKAESIGNGGNFVAFDLMTDTHGRLVSWSYAQDTSELDPSKYNWYEMPWLVWKAVAINLAGDLRNVGQGLDVYFPTLRFTELWTHRLDVELFPELPAGVTTEMDVPILAFPRHEAFVIGTYKSGKSIAITEYRPLGASVFGKTIVGWICLLRATRPSERIFSTSWRLDTVGIIPPEPSPVLA
jgi:hypothetical protein